MTKKENLRLNLVGFGMPDEIAKFRSGGGDSKMLISEFNRLSRGSSDKMVWMTFSNPENHEALSFIDDFSDLSGPIAGAIASSGNVEFLKLALERGLYPDYPDPEYDPSLLFACGLRGVQGYADGIYRGYAGEGYKASAQMTRLLLDAGVDTEATTQDGVTALMRAVRVANVQAVEMLIDAGADIHARDKWGNSMLHYAVTGDNLIVADRRFDERYLKVLDIFLEAGVNVGVKNFDGNTPLHFLRANTPLGRAKAIIERLLDAGANIDARNRSTLSPLLLMARNDLGDGSVFKLMLQMGADPDLKSIQGNGLSRLGSNENKRLVRSILSSLMIDDAMGGETTEEVQPKLGSSSGFGIL